MASKKMSLDQQVENLLSQMTLREKISAARRKRCLEYSAHRTVGYSIHYDDRWTAWCARS